MKYDYDIVFCAIPYSEVSQMYSAPAILKSIVEHEGFKAKAHDFGIDLYKFCEHKFEKFSTIQNYFINDDDSLNKEDRAMLDEFYQLIIQWLKDHPARFIGLSVFSFYTHKCCIELLRLIKQAGIESKIVLGGRGCKVPISWNHSAEVVLGKQDTKTYFGKLLVNEGLADHVIIGDGEDAVINLLKGKEVKLENTTDTFAYPVPDYSDYEVDAYKWDDNGPMIPITGSKGCVRNCDFCDVRFHFGKYQFRTGENIANEMISLNKKHGYRKFQFTDSLVNGSLKVMKEFCVVMAKHNDSNPGNKIYWNGQYICRPLGQTPEEIYPLMKRAGGEGLTVGAESGSIHVLSHMNKKTTSLALFAEMEMFQKYGLTCSLLTFIGHWAEKHENFIEHCKMLVDLVPYIKSGTVSAISLGIPAMLFPGTPAMKEVDRGDVVRLENHKPEVFWYAKYNPQNTFKERAIRRLIVYQIAARLGIPASNELDYIMGLNTMIKQGYKKINDFYEKCRRDSTQLRTSNDLAGSRAKISN